MVYFLCKAYDSDRQNCYFALSLPVRGAWIEMLILRLNRPDGDGRSPCGERGLKSIVQRAARSRLPSLPVRGAWIEILLHTNRNPVYGSLPVRGAWIEIERCAMALRYSAVAPRAGSVD